MGFLSQSEKLRLEAKKRIAAGEFTATELARRVGVSQPTISQFLSAKRNFSLENMDRLLQALALTTAALDVPSPAWKTTPAEPVPLVRHTAAMSDTIITPDSVLPSAAIQMSAPPVKPNVELGPRWTWTRLVAIRATAAHARFMHPTISHDSIVVIDRHCYTPALSNPRIIYAIGDGSVISLGYLREIGGQILLLPDVNDSPPRAVTLAPQLRASHFIVGQVCGVLHLRPTLRSRRPDTSRF